MTKPINYPQQGAAISAAYANDSARRGYRKARRNLAVIGSMNPSADVTASGTVRVDLSGVEPGQRITVKWQGARCSSGAGHQPQLRLHEPSISTSFPILLTKPFESKYEVVKSQRWMRSMRRARMANG